MKFISSEVATCLYKSTILLCMEFCHIQTGAPSCYLDMLDELQNRYVGQLVLHLVPFLSISLFVTIQSAQVFPIGITLVELAPLPCSRGRSTRYSISSIFLSPFLHVIKMSASTSTISFWLELDSGILSLKSAFL